MKIANVVCSKGRTGFYFDDQRAIKAGAQHDGFSYVGETVTPGFHSIRQTGEAVSVMIVLEDGQVAYGDCAAVQYSGAGGRDPLFLAEDFIPVIEKEIKPRLVGRELTSFRQLAGEIDSMVDAKTGKLIHTALRYGVTQAILDAVSKAKHKLMCEVVAEEYNTTVSETAIDIFTQSGDNRYENADKMIIKGAQVLPHALINNVEEKLGKNGELLIEYIIWLKNRVLSLRTSDSYNPVLHIDVYGTIGAAFDLDTERMVSYFRELEKAAAPLKLRIEGPMDVEDREKQMLALKEITARLHEEKINVEVVADEWCNTLEDIKYFADNNAGDMLQIKTPDLGGINNTIEAVLYCKEKGVGAYQGGTCNETDRSAQVCVHLAMATKPVQMLAKPGMGVDEGIMIVYNEMQRILAVRQARKA
ncbi:methylaspartate ammonia-lyase [Pelosinus propionicus]|uniref:methylaspartate ammonia-lyase n=1 Tax=Pelosinus propionicus DSM 13327 TaxID=1123291 RepID=A0A1I4JFG3_9FIRM|nr:methylaspartate ammonia-lyase [Pelosinus propionicus]SFL65328.1 methylaspartate ammonia-lyase [Pelosinus propionicus DSM 13327]